MSDPTVRFPRVLIDVPADVADEMSFELFELGAEGVEQRDESTLDQNVVDDTVTLFASFPSDDLAAAALSYLDPVYNPRQDDVVGDAWRDGWKEHFRPFSLTPSIVIRPPWSTVDSCPGAHVLEMDPGRAFGTGLHATTRLVAQAIERHTGRFRHAAILDVGCGSGVLALCALIHGAVRVRAVDNDPDAVSATRENAERNGFADRIEADTRDVRHLTEVFPLVAANIEARVLCGMARPLTRCVAPSGLLVLSGVLADQVPDVLAAYRDLRHEATHDCEGWVALELSANP